MLKRRKGVTPGQRHRVRMKVDTEGERGRKGKGRKIEEKTWRKRKKERRKERKKGYNAKTGRKNVQVEWKKEEKKEKR